MLAGGIAAIVERRFDELAPETDTTCCGVYEHPAQLCGVAVTQRDRCAADQLIFPFGKPHPTPGIVVEDVLGDCPRNKGFEFQAEPRQRRVGLAVQGDDAAEIAATQFVSDIDCQVLEASTMLAIDASSMALNSSSDCCAARPSDSAREKLATMPFWRDRRSFASSRE